MTVLAVVSATACRFPDLPRIEDDARTDHDAAVDAPADTVLGASFTRYVRDQTVEDVPVDLSAASIQALIPDPAQPTGVRVVAGSGTATGMFRIDGVPEGTSYILKIDREYFVTAAHSVELRREIPIRAGVARASQATLANYDFTGLQTVVDGPNGTRSTFQLVSVGTGAQTDLPVSNGQTGLSGQLQWDTEVSNFFEIAPAPLPDATQGDDLSGLHLWTEVIRDGSRDVHVTSIRDWLPFTGITIADGASVGFTGSATPVPRNRSLMLRVNRGAFDLGYDATSSLGTTSVHISMARAPVSRGLFASPVMRTSFPDWSHATSLDITHNAGWGDPFPATWNRIITLEYLRLRRLLVPGTTISAPLTIGTIRAADFTGTAPPMVPTLGPPSLVRVQGQEASWGGRISFDGVEPIELTWTGSPSARFYRVRLFRAYADGARTRVVEAASLSTAETSARLPAEMFSGGEYFVFMVSALATPTDYEAGLLVANGLPLTTATIVSGVFRLSTTCGNGSVDTGEDCDTTTESASCDSDCSARLCGDGLRNASAGEVCDAIRDTLGCDSDCTAVVCGDGHKNVDAEDCDDGNVTDEGNGCGPQCRYNNVCGDGVVQTLPEECDTTTMSATCDGDCTLPVCGDGVLNTLAGEECDVGDPNGPTGCSDLCTLI